MRGGGARESDRFLGHGTSSIGQELGVDSIVYIPGETMGLMRDIFVMKGVREIGLYNVHNLEYEYCQKRR